MIRHAVIKLFVHLSAYGAIGTEVSHVEATAGSARAVSYPASVMLLVRRIARGIVTFETAVSGNSGSRRSFDGFAYAQQD